MRSVLLIEDDESIRDTVKLALEFGHIPVAVASNGREALKLLEKMERPGLILLDMMMPVLDGWGFLEELDRLPALSRIPVVAMTASGEKADSLPVAEVVTKPLDLRALLKVANAYCA